MSPEKIKHKNRKTKKRKKIFRKWHRRIGFAASLFLFNLAVTGILLNHYETLELHKRYIQNSLLLDWYQVSSPSNIQCVGYSADTDKSNQVCQVGSYTYQIKNEKQPSFLFSDKGKLLGLIKKNTNVYLLTSEQLNIYTQKFELIDSLSLFETNIFETSMSDPILPDGSYQKIEGALIIDGALVIKTENKIVSLDEDTFELQDVTTQFPDLLVALTNQPSPLENAALSQQLSAEYRAKQISVLKLVQDLHSGQILSVPGKLLTDLTGLIIMLLAISGFITWQRRKNSA